MAGYLLNVVRKNREELTQTVKSSVLILHGITSCFKPKTNIPCCKK